MMNKIKSNDPVIVSITYSLKLDKKAYDKCWEVDKKCQESLEEKLQKLPGIVSADYVFLPNEMVIKFETDNIKKVDPKYNNQLWQTIARIINGHIKEE